MQNIGTRVAALRVGKQVSQRELADRCGVSQPTIANIERGRTTEVKGYVLEALARELSVSSKFILEGVKSEHDHETTMLNTELSHIFWELNQTDRDTIMTVARAMHGKKPAKPHKNLPVIPKKIARLQN